MTPYRERKVRILNGAHTMTVLAAYLAGKETVRECMDDPLIRRYMERGIERGDPADADAAARGARRVRAQRDSSASPTRSSSTTCSSIALNSVSKYKARILRTVTRLRSARSGTLPPRLTFALAALIAFYRGARSATAR